MFVFYTRVMAPRPLPDSRRRPGRPRRSDPPGRVRPGRPRATGGQPRRGRGSPRGQPAGRRLPPRPARRPGAARRRVPPAAGARRSRRRPSREAVPADRGRGGGVGARTALRPGRRAARRERAQQTIKKRGTNSDSGKAPRHTGSAAYRRREVDEPRQPSPTERSRYRATPTTGRLTTAHRRMSDLDRQRSRISHHRPGSTSTESRSFDRSTSSSADDLDPWRRRRQPFGWLRDA